MTQENDGFRNLTPEERESINKFFWDQMKENGGVMENMKERTARARIKKIKSELKSAIKILEEDGCDSLKEYIRGLKRALQIVKDSGG